MPNQTNIIIILSTSKLVFNQSFTETKNKLIFKR